MFIYISSSVVRKNKVNSPKNRFSSLSVVVVLLRRQTFRLQTLRQELDDLQKKTSTVNIWFMW